MAPARVALFDTKGSARQGLGHVVRSVALADKLARAGFRVMFLPLGSARATTIVSGRFSLASLGSMRKRSAPAVVIVDRPDHSAALFRKHRRRWPGTPIVALDCYVTGATHVDVTVNINRAFSRRMGRRTAPAHFEGLGYAILRESFAAARPSRAKARPRLTRLFVALGATDPTGWTDDVIDALGPALDEGLRLEIVGGAAAVRARKSRRIRLHGAVADTARLLGRCDLAITGGGTLMMEAACLGVPAIVVPRTDAERVFSREFEAAGFAYVLETGGGFPATALVAAVRTLTPRAERLRRAAAGRKVIDGRGAERVARIVRDAADAAA